MASSEFVHHVPAELADVIALHRAMFGGYVMEAGTPAPANDAESHTTGATPPQDGEPAPTVTPDGDDAADGDTGAGSDDTAESREIDWKKQARKWEALAKSNAAAVTEAEQLRTETATQATELETLRGKITAYETADQVRTWRNQVAETTGVPAAALAGETLEAIQAHAAVLQPLITATPGTPPQAGIVPTIGDVPHTTSVPLKDQIAAAEKAGEWAEAGRLKAMQLTTK